MTKKWNTLLTLLNNFSKVKLDTNKNYRIYLCKTIIKCCDESESLVNKVVYYFANNRKNNDLLDFYNENMGIKINNVFDLGKEFLRIQSGFEGFTDKYFENLTHYLLKFNNNRIIKQKINPIEISLTIEAIESIEPCFYSYDSKQCINNLLDALYVAYETSLANLKTILGDEKTLILYNSNIAMSDNYGVDYPNLSNNHHAAMIASEIIKCTPTDIIKFNETASYIFINKDKDLLGLKKDVQKAKLDCDTIQSAWDLATLTKQDYKRVFIITDSNYCKNTTSSLYIPYLKDLGNPYVYQINLDVYKPSIHLKDSKIKELFGYTSRIYDGIQSFEFKITNKVWEEINNIKLNE